MEGGMQGMKAVVALGLASVMGCVAPVVEYDNNDLETLSRLSKYDGGGGKQVMVAAGSDRGFRFTAKPGGLSVKFTLNESIELRDTDAEVILQFGTFEFSSGVSKAPTLLIDPGEYGRDDFGDVTYVLYVRNHTDGDLRGVLEIEDEVTLPECDGLPRFWDEDPRQYLAHCDSIMDAAYDNEPSFAVEAFNGCLVRSVWGMNGTPYLAFGGKLSGQSVEMDYDIEDTMTAISTEGEDENGKSYAHVTDTGVDIFDYQVGAIVVEDADFAESVSYDRVSQTLIYREASKDWGLWNNWEYAYSTRVSCRAY
jgi:hypothetical protein